MYQTQYTRNNHFQRSDSEFGKIITVFKFIPIFVVLCFYHTRARNYQPFSNLMMAHTQVIRLCVCVCVWWHTRTQYRTKMCNKECLYLQRYSIILGKKVFVEHCKKQTFTATTGLNSQTHENVSEFYIMEPLILAKTSPNP
jgi:hypothetical protein